MPLNLKAEEPKKGVTVLAIDGEVDLNSSPLLRAAMTPLLKKKKTALIIELSRVNYMDSSGIATLIEGMKLAQKQSIAFLLAAPSGPVLTVFKMAHLDKVFSFHESRDKAVACCDM